MKATTIELSIDFYFMPKVVLLSIYVVKGCVPFDQSRSRFCHRKLDFQKSPSSHFIWRGTKDFSYLIGANFTDPKTGRCAWTNQSSSQGPLGIKLSLTSTKRNVTCSSNSNMGSIAKWKVLTGQTRLISS